MSAFSSAVKRARFASSVEVLRFLFCARRRSGRGASARARREYARDRDEIGHRAPRQRATTSAEVKETHRLFVVHVCRRSEAIHQAHRWRPRVDASARSSCEDECRGQCTTPRASEESQHLPKEDLPAPPMSAENLSEENEGS